MFFLNTIFENNLFLVNQMFFELNLLLGTIKKIDL